MINPIPFIRSFLKYEQKVVISYKIRDKKVTYNIGTYCGNVKQFSDTLRTIADNMEDQQNALDQVQDIVSGRQNQ